MWGQDGVGWDGVGCNANENAHTSTVALLLVWPTVVLLLVWSTVALLLVWPTVALFWSRMIPYRAQKYPKYIMGSSGSFWAYALRICSYVERDGVAWNE